jgi:hypothetical protein
MGLCGDFLRQTNAILLSVSPSATGILIAPSFEDLSPLITHYLVALLLLANQLSTGYMRGKPWKESTYVATCLSTEVIDHLFREVFPHGELVSYVCICA